MIERTAPSPAEAIATIKGQIHHHYKAAAPVHATQIVGSQELAEVFRIAYAETQDLGDEQISTGTLFLAVFDPATGHTGEFLHQAGLNRDKAHDNHR